MDDEWTTKMLIELDDDAFGDAQIRSKLELVMNIEHLYHGIGYEPKIDIYAGWYGLTAFLLLSRTNVSVERIRSYDIDPKATSVALRLNRHFMISAPIFSAFTFDVNKLKPIPGEVDLIVNTAVEHMASNDWFTNIPRGTLVCLQGCDLEHPNEVVPNPIRSFEDLERKYPLEEVIYGPTLRRLEILFDYPTGKFTRYQLVGRKT
jgi:hypothetical protein